MSIVSGVPVARKCSILSARGKADHVGPAQRPPRPHGLLNDRAPSDLERHAGQPIALVEHDRLTVRAGPEHDLAAPGARDLGLRGVEPCGVVDAGRLDDYAAVGDRRPGVDVPRPSTVVTSNV
jgi:hypothetical protein